MKTAKYFLLAVVILSSCEMVVDLDIPPHEPKLVVYSFFEEGQPWEVQVLHSVHVMERQNFKPVTNATVKIFADGVFLEELTHRDGYFYEGQTSPVPGKTYKIEVSAPDFKTVTASDMLPMLVPLASVSVKENVKSPWVSELAEIRLRFNDPAGIWNFYQLEVGRSYFYAHNNPITGEWDSGWYDRNLLFFPNDNSINDANPTGVFDDKIFDGKLFEYTVYMYMHDLGYIPTSDNFLRIKLVSLSKPFYDFMLSFGKQSWNDGDPFTEPIQIKSNILGGYGVFAGKSSSVFVYEIEE